MKRTTRDLEMDILGAFKRIRLKTRVQKHARTSNAKITQIIKYLLRHKLIKIVKTTVKGKTQDHHFLTRKGRKALRLWKEFNDLFKEPHIKEIWKLNE